jgi:hypothetical protein
VHCAAAVKAPPLGQPYWSTTNPPTPPPPRYHPQSDFFTRSADLIARREAILLLLAGSGGAAISLFGLKGAKDAQLPITKVGGGVDSMIDFECCTCFFP